MAPLAKRIERLSTTVFSEFSALAAAHGAVNLGQGFPDFDGPPSVAEAAARAIRDGFNQYAVSAGAKALREAIAEHAHRFYRMQVDPETMVTVTSGATEALFDAILGLCNPGDEVILFEPFYDSYEANVLMAGGTVKGVPLRPPDAQHAEWWFDVAELEAAFTSSTRLIVVNTPHNPTGKVFTRTELEHIAALCSRHDVCVLADEVYEHIVYAPAVHVRMATLPDMAERTVTVSSGGKTFSFTGWKIGWAIAPPALRTAVQRTHQLVTFATAHPFQLAMAEALRLPDTYFQTLAAEYAKRRETLVGALEWAGLRPTRPEGTYFALARIDHLGYATDVEFCRWLTTSVGVAAIPPSAFYTEAHRAQGHGFARFAFCKRSDTLALATQRLGRLRGGLSK